MENSELQYLILQSIQQDENAFRKIVEAYQKQLYTLCYRLLNQEDDARDAVQETFVKIWINLPEYHNDKNFQSWIYKIATNQCLDMYRKNKRMPETGIDEKRLINLLADDDAEKITLRMELGNIIRMLTEKLSPKAKAVFVLSDLEGLETNEIIGITGLSPAQIKSNLYVARQSIRNKLKNYGHDTY